MMSGKNRSSIPGGGPLSRLKIPAIVGSGAWTLSSKIISQASQLTIFIIAARVLTSAEFGFYAFSTAFAILLVVFAEGGWGQFVMKMAHDRSKLDQVGSIALLFGSTMTTVGFVISGAVYYYFEQPLEAGLIALFSCWLLPASITSVTDGLLVARDKLRNQAIIRIAAELVGLSFVIFGLWHGWNVVALVAGRLAMELTVLPISLIVLRWFPRLGFSWTFLLEVLDYSRHIVLNRLIVFVRAYSGTLIVGSFLGLSEAGHYRAAERIVAAVSELVGEPARILAWNMLRKAAGQSPADAVNPVGKAATTFMTILMAISVPIYVGLALMSNVLVHFALGPEWAPVSLLVSLLAIKQIFLTPGYVTEPLLSFSGTIRKMPVTMMINSAVMLGFLFATAPFGIIAMALGHGGASLVSFLISIRLQGRYGGVKWNRILRDCMFVSIAMAAMIAGFFLLGDAAAAMSVNPLVTAAAQVLTAAVIYIAALAILLKISGHTPMFDFGHR